MDPSQQKLHHMIRKLNRKKISDLKIKKTPLMFINDKIKKLKENNFKKTQK